MNLIDICKPPNKNEQVHHKDFLPIKLQEKKWTKAENKSLKVKTKLFKFKFDI